MPRQPISLRLIRPLRPHRARRSFHPLRRTASLLLLPLLLLAIPARAEEPAPAAAQIAAPAQIAASAQIAAPAQRPTNPGLPLLLPGDADALRKLDTLGAQRRTAVLERDIGWALAGVGFGLATSGCIALGLGLGGSARFNEGATLETTGIAALATSVSLLIPGIVLAVHGQDRLAEIDWRLRALSGAGFVAPLRGGGLVAGVTVAF